MTDPVLHALQIINDYLAEDWVDLFYRCWTSYTTRCERHAEFWSRTRLVWLRFRIFERLLMGSRMTITSSRMTLMQLIKRPISVPKLCKTIDTVIYAMPVRALISVTEFIGRASIQKKRGTGL